jgi:hypothetical protein
LQGRAFGGIADIGGSKLDDGALVGFGGRVGNAIEELARSWRGSGVRFYAKVVLHGGQIA